MDNLMEGANQIDHRKCTRDFTGRMKRIVGKAHFEKVSKQYQNEWGQFSRREVTAILRRPESIAIIWRQWCTKQAGEFVAELVLVETDSRYLVDHAMAY